MSPAVVPLVSFRISTPVPLGVTAPSVGASAHYTESMGTAPSQRWLLTFHLFFKSPPEKHRQSLHPLLHTYIVVTVLVKYKEHYKGRNVWAYCNCLYLPPPPPGLDRKPFLTNWGGTVWVFPFERIKIIGNVGFPPLFLKQKSHSTQWAIMIFICGGLCGC